MQMIDWNEVARELLEQAQQLTKEASNPKDDVNVNLCRVTACIVITTLSAALLKGLGK